MPVVRCWLAFEMVVYDHNKCMRTKAGTTRKTKSVHHPKGGLSFYKTIFIRCTTENALFASVHCRAGPCTRPIITLHIAVCIGAASISASESPF